MSIPRQNSAQSCRPASKHPHLRLLEWESEIPQATTRTLILYMGAGTYKQTTHRSPTKPNVIPITVAFATSIRGSVDFKLLLLSYHHMASRHFHIYLNSPHHGIHAPHEFQNFNISHSGYPPKIEGNNPPSPTHQIHPKEPPWPQRHLINRTPFPPPRLTAALTSLSHSGTTAVLTIHSLFPTISSARSNLNSPQRATHGYRLSASNPLTPSLSHPW